MPSTDAGARRRSNAPTMTALTSPVPEGQREQTPLEAMTDPRTYAERPHRVEVVATHASWVFLAGSRAYKIKKPVTLSFLDYSTLEKRRALCREEARLNRRLAPNTYLGTVALVRRGDRFALIADDAEADDAIEFAVEMRRYDEQDTLAARIESNSVTDADLERVGQLLAGFHTVAGRSRDFFAAQSALRAAMDTTLDDLAAAAVSPARIAALRRMLGAFMTAREQHLRGRARAGLLRDGHGDLRAEHVLLTDPPEIVDCVEFDPALRIADVAVDLAFLVMDLEARDTRCAARRIIDAYRTAGGNPGDDAMLSAFACFRALVRAKVAAVRAGQDAADHRLSGGWKTCFDSPNGWRGARADRS